MPADINDSEKDEQVSKVEEIKKEERSQNRIDIKKRAMYARIDLACQLELFLLCVLFLALYYSEFISLREELTGPFVDTFGNKSIKAPEFGFLLARSIGDFRVLIALTVLFLDIFNYLLTGNTIIVGSIRNRSALSRFSSGLNGLKQKRDDDYDSYGSLFRYSSTNDVQKAFIKFLERSKEAAKIAQRRPNALLFVGTVVAGVGLVFFIITLPGFITVSSGTIDSGDFWRKTLDLVPRLLMLLFIQLLAGFFLRQYRSSMEEYRYYEAVLRHREAQFLSYLLRLSMQSNVTIERFAEEILEEKDFFRLSRGETTLVMEAQKQEVNEFKDLMTSIFDFMKSTRSRIAHGTDIGSGAGATIHQNSTDTAAPNVTPPNRPRKGQSTKKTI